MKLQLTSLSILTMLGCLHAEELQNPGKSRDAVTGPTPIKRIEDLRLDSNSFTFVRAMYSGGKWHADYPFADLNFSQHIAKVTGLKSDPDPISLKLTDSELKDYPFIYMAKPGSQEFSEAETKGLRSYLENGGFLMVDDFWGKDEWSSFSGQIKKVFPDLEPRELPINHPIFSFFYQFTEKPQVSTFDRKSGKDRKRDGELKPQFRGLFDRKGRLMALFCHNNDIGDGWENVGESDYYDKEFSYGKAFPIGINVALYAMSEQDATDQEPASSETKPK